MAIKILLLDIETSPNTAYVWALWKQNISTDKIINSSSVLCWAAKWYGEREVLFDSIHKSRPKVMLRRMHRLLDKADVVITYFGDSFDLPTLSKEFVSHGFLPPAPFKKVDLCRVVQRTFRFPSSKLDYVGKALGLGMKTRHTGFEMWIQCMARDAKAWKLMEKYNRRDVTLLEQLYDKLKPWITNHPNHNLHAEMPVCTNCGDTRIQRRGISRSQVHTYARYQCQACGAWLRGTKAAKSYKTTLTGAR